MLIAIPIFPHCAGFVQNAEHNLKGMGLDVMSGFTSESAPVINTLAQEFAMYDHYHAAVPGPTEVNRMYFFSATSHGSGTNDVLKIALGYPQKSIFKSLREQGIDWNVYYGDIPSALTMLDMRTPEAFLRQHLMEEFPSTRIVLLLSWCVLIAARSTRSFSPTAIHIRARCRRHPAHVHFH